MVQIPEKIEDYLKIDPSDFTFPYDESKPFGSYRLSSYHNFVYKLFRNNLLPRDLVFDKFLRSSMRQYKNGIVDATIAGISMRMKPAFNTSEAGLLRRGLRYDEKEWKALANSCRMTINPVFIDVGANAGLYSLLITKAVPSVRVLAFEPHPGFCRQLKFNLNLNPGHSISVHEYAMSDQLGKVWLKTHTKNNAQTRIEPEGDVEVECTTLQTVVEKEHLSRIDALKIDIEGHEDRALVPYLRDAPDSLLPRVIVCEVNKKLWKEDPLDVALSRGYEETKYFTWNRRQKNYILVYSN